MFELPYEADPQAFAEALVDLSPVTHVAATDPPVLIAHGDSDTLVDPEQSRLLQAAMERAGIEYEVHFVEGADHVFNGATPAQIEELVDTTINFILINTF